MYNKPALSLTDVEFLLAAAKKSALQNSWKVSIAVCDDGGHPLGVLRLDGASPFTVQTAIEKARTAAMGRRESRIYEEMINGGRTAFLSAPLLQGILEGGVNILVGGQTVGAVGVSGVQSAEDAQVAKFAIQELLAHLAKA